MDILKSKTATGITGFSSLAIGLSLAQVVGVFRQGEQKDYTASVGALNGSNWTFRLPNVLSFGAAYPLRSGEVIYIIYKVTT